MKTKTLWLAGIVGLLVGFLIGLKSSNTPQTDLLLDISGDYITEHERAERYKLNYWWAMGEREKYAK